MSELAKYINANAYANAIAHQHILQLEVQIATLTRERDEARQQLADKDREIERLDNWAEALTAYAEQAKRESRDGGDGD